MRVGIVGGGIMGTALGWFLQRQGIAVDIYKAAPELAGLAGPLQLADGTLIDRYYHAILSSDRHLRELCAALGIADQLRFRETKMGFYYRGQIFSMNNVVEFLKFPPLNMIDRVRLGVTVLAAQMVRDWRSLETVSVEEWLIRYAGRNGYENIWKPLLKAKFDGGFDNVPATWIWSRLVRMKSTRDGANQKEEAGHLIGGYSTLLDAMAAEILSGDNNIYLSTPVQEIVVENGRTSGLRTNSGIKTYDAVVATVQTPLASRLLPSASASFRSALAQQEYLGIVCPVLVLDRPLSGYWTLNITDDSIPFTGVIETTSYIDTAYTGGNHLVYLPKYTAPGSELQSLSDDEVRSLWLANVRRMFPGFDESSIRDFVVNRTRYVEPLHGLGETEKILPIETEIPGLFLATTAQIYPDLTNGESVTRHALRAAEQVQAFMARTESGQTARSVGFNLPSAPEVSIV